MSLIRGLLSLVIAAAAVLFAVANMESVTVRLAPFQTPLEVPLFLVGLTGALAGFVAGVLLMWLRSLGPRLKARKQERRIEALEKDLEEAGLPQALPARPAPKNGIRADLAA